MLEHSPLLIIKLKLKTMWKECNIHLLPSNEASSSMVIEVCKKQLSDLNIGQLAYTPRLMPSKEYFDIINLYVTDDSEIREGDWIIWNSKVVQAINTKYHKTTKKIIATTDTSLNLSQIPKQFIEYYISEYNAGRKIEKVDVEEVEYMTEGWIPTYNNPDNHNLDKEAELDYRLKLSPTNEISIKPVEDAKELLKQRDDIENQGSTSSSIEQAALIS